MPLPSPHPPHVYSSYGIDRATERRRDRAWLEARLRAPESRLVAVSDLRVRVLDAEGERPSAAFLPVPHGATPEDTLFLGLDEAGHAVFMREAAADADLPGSLVELRSVGNRMPAGEAGLLAYARGMSFWQERHRFCGRCGGSTHGEQGGHVRKCDRCGLEHFPRTDPAIIVLVSRGDRALLGRSHRLPPGMFSTLAGFVEPGEALESAVVREVFEETGIVVQDPRYRSSQPWPFPASLMLGFRAEAVTEVITLDPSEMDDARWFPRAAVRDPASVGLRLPGADSIARVLIEEWLDGD